MQGREVKETKKVSGERRNEGNGKEDDKIAG